MNRDDMLLCNNVKVVGELTSMKSLDERLARTAQILDGVTPFPADELSSAAASFYYKLDAADKYKPSAKFKGNVTLVRAIDNYVQMGDDYGLSAVNIYIFLYLTTTTTHLTEMDNVFFFFASCRSAKAKYPFYRWKVTTDRYWVDRRY